MTIPTLTPAGEATPGPSSRPAPQVATSGPWSATKPPTDGRPIYVMAFRLVKYTHYKPDGRRQMKQKGRWQQAGEYGGWDNCAEPVGPWILAGHTIPDALMLAEAAPAGTAIDPEMPLPCDVNVAPATIIRKGVPLRTLLLSIKQRVGRPEQDTRFPEPAPAGTGADVVEGLRKAAQDVANRAVKDGMVKHWAAEMVALRAALDGASGQEGRS